MAVDLTDRTPATAAFTTTLNANAVAFELRLPRWANKIILQPDTDDIRVSYSGVDGAALVAGTLHAGDFSVEYDIVKDRQQAHPILPTPVLYLQTAAQPTVVNGQLVR